MKSPYTSVSEIIEMAWCDKTSFDDIQNTMGLSEKQVIKIMQLNLKPSSFRLWRQRVSGRSTKHKEKRQLQAKGYGIKLSGIVE